MFGSGADFRYFIPVNFPPVRKHATQKEVRPVRRTLTFLFLLLIVVSLFAGVSQNSVTNASGSEDFVPGEVVVKLSKSSDLTTLAAQYKLNPTPVDQFGTRPIYRLRLADNGSVTDRVDVLSHDSRVVFVEPNYVAKPPVGGGNTWSVGNTWPVCCAMGAAKNTPVNRATGQQRCWTKWSNQDRSA
jgi:hypothetical protein